MGCRAEELQSEGGYSLAGSSTASRAFWLPPDFHIFLCTPTHISSHAAAMGPSASSVARRGQRGKYNRCHNLPRKCPFPLAFGAFQGSDGNAQLLLLLPQMVPTASGRGPLHGALLYLPWCHPLAILFPQKFFGMGSGPSVGRNTF